MNRQKPVSYSAHHLTVIFLAVCSVYFLKSTLAADTSTHLEAPENFKITYHEKLDYRFETLTNIASNPSPDTAARKDQSGSEVMIFRAFGRQFKLLLEPNAELISKLPTKQKSDLMQNMQVFRGVIDEVDGSWVRISRLGKKVSGMFWDGSEIYVIDDSNEVMDALPNDSVAQRSYSLIYRLSDTLSDHQRCGLDPAAKPLNDYTGLVEELSDRLQSLPQAASQLDIAIVADPQFVSNNANPDAAVVARMNVVDGIYSEQVGVHLRISEIRSLQANAGLTSTSPGTLLNQFSQFSNSSGFNNPGLAHLFTGRDLNGSTIGIAYLSSLCSDRFGVGISQVGGGGTAGALTVAHEIGHNFGAPHDNQSGSACASTPSGFIMNPVLNGSDTFSQCSLSQIQPNVQNAACISIVDPTSDADVAIAFVQNPITATVDEVFDYDIEVNNIGTLAAANVFAQISLPVELTAQSTSVNGGSCANNNAGGLDCNLNNINPGSTKTISIKVLASQEGQFTSTVDITADNDINPGNNSASVAIDVSDINTNSLIDADFDAGADGFAYADDTFRNTNQTAYARGRFRPASGFSGGGLQVLLGGRDNQDINDMSGGWQQDFQLNQATRLGLSLRVKLSQARNYETDEISEALVAIDGSLVGPNSNGHLLRIRGDGNGGSTITTGWRKITVTTGQIAAGQHTLTIGGYNNKKTFRNEVTEVLIDDVVLTETTQPDDNIPTAQCPKPSRFATNGKGLDFCWFEKLSAPVGAKPYCNYLNSHQTLGYSFDIKLPRVCPPGSRATSNGSNLNFCLFENLPVPTSAKAECDGLESDERIGYSFPRS